MIYFVVPAAGEFGMRDYLALWGRNLAERIGIVHYESLPARKQLERGTYILAGLDQLGEGMLRVVEAIHARLHDAGCRILNHPTLTLRRFELLRELHRRKLNDFGVMRASDDLNQLRYPVFLRSERDHDGAISTLLHSRAEVEQEIGRALLHGRVPGDLLVVEFCDTADEHGYYRKYSAFIVRDRIIGRHLPKGREWMVKHGTAEFTRAMVLEERDFVMHPHEEQLAGIFRIARAEYGRIDYALKDGRVQTWEINLNPTIGRGLRPSRGRVPPELEPIRTETKERFYRGFETALTEIDSTAGGPPIPIAFSPALITAASSGNGPRRHRLLSAAGHMLRPVKPLVRPLLPLLGRLARRN